MDQGITLASRSGTLSPITSLVPKLCLPIDDTPMIEDWRVVGTNSTCAKYPIEGVERS